MARLIEFRFLKDYHRYLQDEEKSAATVDKYIRDMRAFAKFAGEKEVTKALAVSFKDDLVQRKYAVRSVNSILASINSFFTFMGWDDCKIKTLRCQRQIYCAENKELTKAEYMRLLAASKGSERLNLILQTICATGIRISELKFFTVKAIHCGEVYVRCKNKTRPILIPGKLRALLNDYARRNGIKGGAIFISRSGKILDRSNIWAQMKKLCKRADVNPSKVFPHNLRKLFARTFYSLDKDIAKLADILGHGSIETTRIYIMTTGAEHRRKLDRLGLVV